MSIVFKLRPDPSLAGARSGGFVQVPSAMFEHNGKLPPYDRLYGHERMKNIYLCLVRFAGTNGFNYNSMTHLANACGVTQEAIKREIFGWVDPRRGHQKGLIDLGFLTYDEETGVMMVLVPKVSEADRRAAEEALSVKRKKKNNTRGEKPQEEAVCPRPESAPVPAKPTRRPFQVTRLTEEEANEQREQQELQKIAARRAQEARERARVAAQAQREEGVIRRRIEAAREADMEGDGSMGEDDEDTSVNAWERHLERREELRKQAKEPVDYRALFGVQEEVEEPEIEEEIPEGEWWPEPLECDDDDDDLF